MKVVLQRVKRASVKSAAMYHEIGPGLLLLVGIGEETVEQDVPVMAKKIVQARLFEDHEDKMNLSIKEIGGEILSISQFTLYADVRKGNRPSFTRAMRPDTARAFYESFNRQLAAEGVTVKPGDFGEMMDIELINDGPVTVIYECHEGKIR
ncbi:D-aminoacyl-tRNA deacylase [Macrococcus equipercicus]|uniref:D-aminoacyl-tRNA deacylase n=1 Tax=Macrococcus equipercicus TaxID=69967 RepID=A0A9Q9BNZ2_9STAP|nr:D-aminoacyl-tRNA deacylase [Macrococcus equipercicus]KAA1040016.1 D-tyrosyl-tRNA(Tyr) deacylase [Macrococcus equipercicus]UTH13051.1 D-tyrosyl-tRNA(Tyr) deacylase [Macrococcus equipercicus]